MLNKKLTSCSPVFLQDLEEDDDDEEFEVRRSSSPNFFLNHNHDTNILFSNKSSSNNTFTPTPTPITSGEVNQFSYGGITAPVANTLFSHNAPVTFTAGASGASGVGVGGAASSSVNNAITLAPSRNHHHHDPNVFAGGRPPPKKHHHKRHKGHHNPNQQKSPHQDEGSILTRIDHSIMSNFGDWNTVEDDPPHPKLVIKQSRSNHRPYYLPSKQGPTTTTSSSSSDNTNNMITSELNGISEANATTSLPKLFKPYEVVVNDNSSFMMTNNHHSHNHNPALPLQGTSKDNTDPHSILSEAKRTLNAYGVH